MKILHLINALSWGGAQILVADLARHLSPRHQVRVATFRDGPIGAQLRREGIPVDLLSEHCFDLPGYARLLRLIREFQPDILHSHLFRATFWARLARGVSPGLPLLTSVHGKETSWYHRLEHTMARLTDVFVFPSHYLATWYSQTIRPLPASRCRIWHPGARMFPEFKRPPQTRVPRIGTLSRLHPVKGLDTLLEAARHLRGQGFPFELCIGGEGRDRGRLEHLVAGGNLAGQVHFAGEVSSIREYLDSLDIFVAPSLEEGFGITLCEAMERSLPVIVSDTGGLREIMGESSAGAVFPAGNAVALAERLEEYLRHPALGNRAGVEGRRRVERHFQRRTWLEHHEALYQSYHHSSPPSVHLAISSPELGGGERLALAIGAQLRTDGRRVTATCAGNPLQAKLHESGIPASCVSMKAGGFFFLARLARDLRQQAPQVVHAHLNKASLMAGLLRRLGGPPLVAHVHGLNRASYYRWADHLFAVSASVAAHLTDQGLPPHQITTLPNSIPTADHSVNRSPGPPWNIGIIAKLHANKGHAWALQALQKHVAELPDLRLWLFGDGPERAVLEASFAHGPLRHRLTFFGFQDSLEPWYQQLHLVVLPSLGEGIPLSLLEACSWSIPVIGTRVGGIPEIIETGRNGLLVEPFDHAGLIAALREVLEPTRWQSYSQQALAVFRQKNAFPELVKGVATRLNSLLSRPGS
jgi:glycosyltransferase involved in cell wall biosynthesis